MSFQADKKFSIQFAISVVFEVVCTTSFVWESVILLSAMTVESFENVSFNTSIIWAWKSKDVFIGNITVVLFTGAVNQGETEEMIGKGMGDLFQVGFEASFSFLTEFCKVTLKVIFLFTTRFNGDSLWWFQIIKW